MDIKLNRNNLYEATNKVLEKLELICTPREFHIATDLYYEGHTPVVAYLILDGKVNLTKRKKIKTIAERGVILGIKELMSHSPCEFGAKVQPNSKICFLDKSTIFEILNCDDQYRPLGEVLSKVVS